MEEGKFWHISDFHYDPLLKVEKRSCVLDVKSILPWGSEYCDSNLQLVKSALDAMKRIESQPDFILWTGDTALHYWKEGSVGTKEEIVDIVTVLSEMMNEAFPDVPVISSLGNHDYVPDNQLPAAVNEIYTNISNVWNRLGWFDGEISKRESFRQYGYYTVRLSSGLVATALNTNFYYLGNKVYESLPDDPGQQFAMLEDLLQFARTNSTKVLISAHVPFGVGAKGDYIHMYKKYNEQFVSLVREYHDVIIGLFFGHEHNAAVKVLFDEDDKEVVSVAYLCPSITPWRYIAPDGVESPYHNPSVLLYEYDGNQIMDYTQYYFDLREANAGKKNVTWSYLLRLTEAFGVRDASPPSMQKVAESIRDDKKLSEYLQSYYCKKDVESCDDDCRAGLSCAIFEVSQTGAKACVAAITSKGQHLRFDLTLLWITALLYIAYCG
ncbi:acid sphingomyelinase-like phosphodiesterase 3b isoform X2 [Watersipora subatra]|uniref:acid sphingomyelinase-like phosphodiesterase 3b isoform X2 n=1 Tax=Watersipora subatra TaxID=2589382 RepID=UPI00355B9DC9